MLSRTSDQRTFPVCLREIALPVRLKAVSCCLGSVSGPEEASDLIAAAVSPSATVYYLRPSAAGLYARVAA